MSQVKKMDIFDRFLMTDVEKNIELMLENFRLNDYGKGQLKDLNVQAKEFSMTVGYQPKKSD